MEAVIDSATLISLAWSGLLRLVAAVPVTLTVPDAVYEETVVAGLAAGHPDAAAIEAAIAPLPRVHHPASPADDAVLAAAEEKGGLVTNDAALGRRAANLGVRWLRTADLVLLCVRSDCLDVVGGRAALDALHAAGRVTDDLLHSYEKELR